MKKKNMTADKDKLTMHWERVCNTWKLTTADNEYGFFLVPDKVDETLYNECLYDVYMGYCHNIMQLLSKLRMSVNEAKDMVETIVTKFKTLK